MRPALFREAVDRLRAHHQAGERVVLLSASSWYLLQRFRHVLPIDDVIGFRQRMQHGRLVNDFDRPIPYGSNKLTLARRYAEGQGVDLRDCAFYSDSSSDAPLLRAVGRPFAVNPDPWLRAEARLRGWPVLRFRETTGRQGP